MGLRVLASRGAYMLDNMLGKFGLRLSIYNMASRGLSFSNLCTWIILEVVFLLLFRVCNYCSPFDDRGYQVCDTTNSSIVRKVVQKNWIPLLSRYGVALPIDCPLNFQRDYLGRREEKKLSHKSHWQCSVCGKRFYSETNLDLHIERKHADIINKADDSVCFSQFCDIMRCNIVGTSSIMEQGLDSTDISVWTPTADSKHPSKEAESPAKTPNSDASQPNLERSHLQEDKNLNSIQCNENYYSSLRQKCADLVWECLRGLIAYLDAADFKYIQYELESKSCSFLSCSKYADLYCNSRNDRIALRPFLIVFGSLLFSLSLAVAYYFSWIYTEKYCNTGICSSI